MMRNAFQWHIQEIKFHLDKHTVCYILYIYSRLRLIRPHQNTIFLYELTVVTN